MVAGCLGRLVRTGWYHQSRDGWSGVSVWTGVSVQGGGTGRLVGVRRSLAGLTVALAAPGECQLC